jgi:NitT/TauT family transport system permease protein
MMRTNFAGLLFVVLVTVLVEAGVRLFGLGDSIAAPSATVRALGGELSSGALSAEIGTTLAAFAQGFAIAIAGGIVLGVAIGSSRTLRHASWLLVEFLRPIPVVAMIPLAILFFGLGLPMRRFVIAYAAFWPILVNTVYGARGSDRLLHDVARTSGVTTVGRLARVTLPSALPSIGAGIRVSASIALLVGVTAEIVIAHV